MCCAVLLSSGSGVCGQNLYILTCFYLLTCELTYRYCADLGIEQCGIATGSRTTRRSRRSKTGCASRLATARRQLLVQRNETDRLNGGNHRIQWSRN